MCLKVGHIWLKQEDRVCIPFYPSSHPLPHLIFFLAQASVKSNIQSDGHDESKIYSLWSISKTYLLPYCLLKGPPDLQNIYFQFFVYPLNLQFGTVTTSRSILRIYRFILHRVGVFLVIAIYHSPPPEADTFCFNNFNLSHFISN